MKTRPVYIDGDIAFISLTKGHQTLIDAIDLPLVERWNWFASINSQLQPYAVRRSYDVTPSKVIRLHRIILDAPEWLDVDHIDGNTLNNRRSNLRLATRSQNCQNQKVNASNLSGLKGVSWRESRKKWQAQIMRNYKKYYLGLFDTPEAAYSAYCIASKSLHGHFGRTS